METKDPGAPTSQFRMLPSEVGGRRFFNSRAVMAIAFAVILGVLIANAYIIQRNLGIVQGHQKDLETSHALVSELDLLLSSVKDAETGQRGYLISGLDEYLTPYTEARSEIFQHRVNIENLTTDFPVQRQSLQKLSADLDANLDMLEVLVNGRRNTSNDAARELFLKSGARQLMNDLRAGVEVMKDYEQRRIRQRSELVDYSWTMLARSLFFSTLLSIGLVCASYFFLRRYTTQQEVISRRYAREAWLKTHQADLAEAMRGDQSIESLGRKVMDFCSQAFEILGGRIYGLKLSTLELLGAYAQTETPAISSELNQKLALSQGIAGEAATQMRTIHIQDVPRGYFQISSSTGRAEAGAIVAFPLVHNGKVKGVVELARFRPFNAQELELVNLIADDIAGSLQSAQDRTRLQDLLEETQRQAEELQVQQEELRTSNEELEARANALVETKNRLQEQQEELRQINEELDEKSRLQQEQAVVLEERNQTLLAIKSQLEGKAHELELANQYKSEFLANMSHELRTPLNSLLLLATLLTENREGRLSDTEIEFARTIYRSGNDLLNLINDILDLAKVEAGKLELNPVELRVDELAQDIDRTFRHVAEVKGLSFSVTASQQLPKRLYIDKQRLEQVLRNFLSNAVKFTEQGEVKLEITPGNAPGLVRFTVSDTGIGIPEEKLGLIFEAFHQVDGSTSRQYGGTGLGLTISRQLAELMQGAIHVESSQGRGSSFSLEIPERWDESKAEASMASAARKANFPVSEDAVSHSGQPPRYEDLKRSTAQPGTLRKDTGESPSDLPPPIEILGDTDSKDSGERKILIIEDDQIFAKTIYDIAHEAGYKALLAYTGESGLAALKRYKVEGVIADIKLPDISGLAVLERIKDDPRTRHLPIHMISALDYANNALKLGAIGYLVKPVRLDELRVVFQRIEGVVKKTIKKVLVVEDDVLQRGAICELLGGADIECIPVGTAAAASEHLSHGGFDCMILDLRLPDKSGFELLEDLHSNDIIAKPPVVVYTGQDLSKSEEERLRRYSESIIIKGARSPERLLDEVGLFLHRVEANLPQNSKAMLKALREREKIFENRQILLVDDDMRNVFALVNVLEARGLKIIVARNGKEALERLDSESDIDLVLMDIMMPVMDGFEAMRKIREQPRFKKLPVLALTAKAMKDDQDKCLEAGANDYMAKPIQIDRLLSLLRVWLPQHNGI